MPTQDQDAPLEEIVDPNLIFSLEIEEDVPGIAGTSYALFRGIVASGERKGQIMYALYCGETPDFADPFPSDLSAILQALLTIYNTLLAFNAVENFLDHHPEVRAILDQQNDDALNNDTN